MEKAPVVGQPSTEKLHGCKAGLILICDIVDFSRLKKPEQTAAIDRLWRFVNDRKWMKPLGSDRLINGTGDGFMIACPNHKTDVAHADFIRFADAMVRHMARARPSLGLRVGVHQGAFDQLKMRFATGNATGKSFHQGVGRGINRCARIVAIGDDGDITVSEDFIDAWDDDSRDHARRKFSPRPPKPPFEVAVKHGETLKLRFYRPGSRVNRPWPKKIKAFKAAMMQLHTHLRLLGRAFVDYATLLDPTLTAEKIDIRVSIFAEGRTDDDTPMMLPTSFRYHPEDHGTEGGATCYPITNGGGGPVGQAYARKRIDIRSNLPDWRSHRKNYVRALKKSGLDPATVKAFRRHARTFVAIPFGLLPARPDGVICVDTMSPLNNLSLKNLSDMANFIRQQFGITLASLWRLRGQV